MKGKLFKRVTALLSTAAMLLTCADFSAIDFSVQAEDDEPILTDFDVNGNGEIEEGEKGWGYKLDSASDLYWFAGKVNGGDTSANAFLADDITVNENLLTDLITVNDGTATVNEGKEVSEWTPIGNDAFWYSGTFNGNNHTISGLYFNDSSKSCVGLFGYVGTGGKIQDVTIADSYFCGNGKVGGICESNYGTIENAAVADSYMYGNSVGGVCGGNNGTISKCYNTGDVTGSNNVGGVCGINIGTITDCSNTGNVSGNMFVGGVCGGNTGTISNCYNTGDVSGTGNFVGGVCGRNEYNAAIKNCYNTGDVKGTENFVSGVCGGNTGTISNCYYLDTIAENGIGNSPDAINGPVTAKSAQQFASGEVCWLLNVEQSDNPVFYQNIGKDISPVLDSTHHAVKHSETSYYNEHSYENGFCTVCGYEPATDSDEDGTYEISNAGQLYWFAEQVNSGNTAINAELTNDITVNSGVLNENGKLNEGDFREWTPIGTYTSYYVNSPYSGTFDGNNKTISGLYFNKSGAGYVGLFGYVGTGGKIQDVTIADSYMYGETFVGGVCGSNTGTITNCYNTGDVSGDGCVGGVCGYAVSANIKECSNAGTVEGYGSVGGICGYASSANIRECSNAGTVTGNHDVGGICGYASSANIRECSNAGTAEGYEYVGGICGNSINSTIENSFNINNVINMVDSDVEAVTTTPQVTTTTTETETTTATETTDSEDLLANSVGCVCGNMNGGYVIKCYSSGKIVNEISRNECIRNFGNIDENVIITDFYYLTDTDDGNGGKTAQQFASGEVCYLLNGGETQSAPPVFYQTLGEDAFPVLDSTHSTVYIASPCQVYSNTENTAHITTGKAKVEPTCTEYGCLAYYMCETCGKCFTDAECKNEIADIEAWKSDPANGRIAMLMHQTDNYPETKATCTTDGHKAYYHCSLCDQYFSNSAITEVIEDIDEWLNAENGGKIPATGHNLTKSDEIKADCNNDGHKAYWFCEKCMKFFSDEACTKEIDNINEWHNDVNGGKIPAGHKIKKEDKLDATCTTDGHKDYWYCQECGDYFSDEACENRIYSIDEWLNDENGGKIPGGHNVIKEEKHNATCTTDGCEAYWYCSVCKKYFSDEECKNEIANIDTWKLNDGKIPGGHNGIKQEKYNATCETDGCEAYWYCQECGKYFSDEECKNEIANLDEWKNGEGKIPGGHKIKKEEKQDATCESAGHKAFWYCEICKECFLDAEGTEEIENIAAWLSDETKGCIPKLSHSFDAKGFCTTCENGYQPATDSNGDGTYEISNAGQLYWFADKVNRGNKDINVILTNDITVNENLLSELISVNTEYSATVREWTPIGDYTYTNNYITYKGTFNGKGNTISGLYFNKEQDFVGLFGCVEGGKVQDVIVADSYFCGSSNVGGVCGYNYYGTIENCSNIGDVTATGYNAYNAYVGGICGVNAGGTIENCSSSGINVAIAEIPYVGGVCGANICGTIENCSNTGDVTGTGNFVGGVCGYNVDNSTIENCYNKGVVTGYYAYVGGVCGYNEGTITNCYFLDVEGLVGVYYDDSESADVKAMTDEQFASGEAAYKLGKAFFQTLGEDAFPVLDETHGTVYITTPCNVYSNTAKHLLRICDRKGKSCTEDGHEAYWYCEICNKYYSDSEGTNTIENIDEWLTGEGRIPAGHAAYILEQYEPTCVMDGCKAYWFCENCRKYYVDEECTKLITDREDFEFGEGRIPATGIHVYKNGYCEECGKPENSKEYFYSAGLTITDGTIINYLVNVDDDFDTTNAKIIFSIENGKKTEISFSEAKNLEDTNNYIFALPVAPNLMREKITAQVVRTDGSLGSSLEYSVEDYLVQCLEMFGDDGPEVKETVDAIRAYGDFAKAYSEKSAATPEYAQNCEIGSEFNYEKTENAEGLKIQSASLILSAGVSIHLQYKVTDGKDYTFSYNGKNELRVEKNGDIYDVYLDGIFPQDFDEMFEFTSSDGDTFTYSVFTYIKDKIGSDDISLTNLLNSMYEYNQTIEKILV